MNELVVKNNIGAPTEHELAVFHTMSKYAVTSKLYKGIGDESGVMMIMLAARELGLPPIQCLNGGLNIINGKVEISARMMNALIRKYGHSIKIVESTENACKLVGTRVDNGDQAEASYTLAEAKQAGLVKPGGGWTKNPKDMCFARALSRLARQLFADVIGTGYIEGEISQAKETWNHPFMKAPESFKAVQIEQLDIELEPQVPEMAYDLRYVSIFPPEDADKAFEYKNIVKKHFKWDDAKTYEELLKDKVSTVAKFKAWKEKKVD